MSYLLDSNIIIYAFDETSPAKHAFSREIFDASFTSGRFTLRQILGEVLNAAHKKRHVSVARARDAVQALSDAVTVHPTDALATVAASELAERYQLQYFDALICTLGRRHGASVLLSEDMQDGFRIGGFTIVNPFAEKNRQVLAEILAT